MKILFLILFLCIFSGGALIGYGLGTMRALDIISKELRGVASLSNPADQDVPDDIRSALCQITKRL